jgi:DnaJ-class molecular chaperone
MLTTSGLLIQLHAQNMNHTQQITTYKLGLLKHTFAADIVFIVKDKPHSIFKREGKDLFFTATVPLGKVCTIYINPK